MTELFKYIIVKYQTTTWVCLNKSEKYPLRDPNPARWGYTNFVLGDLEGQRRMGGQGGEVRNIFRRLKKVCKTIFYAK